MICPLVSRDHLHVSGGSWKILLPSERKVYVCTHEVHEGIDSLVRESLERSMIPWSMEGYSHHSRPTQCVEPRCLGRQAETHFQVERCFS